MDAETAYIFRHAVLRDAAYDLQPPEERATLHGLAHDAIALLFEGRERELDAMAVELARHAGAAALHERECHWLQRAAKHASLGWRGAEAANLFMRVAAHRAADNDEKSQALCGAGKALIDIGRLPEALSALERALNVATSDTGRLLALRPLSYAYRNVGRNEDALAAARRIEQIGRSSANPSEQALMLDAIATALMGMERNDEALPLAEQALQMAELGGEARFIGGISANLGLLLARVGRRAEGVEMMRRAVTWLSQTDERRSLAAARRNLADQLRSDGRPTEALPECELALAEMQALDDKRGMGMAAMTLGGLHRDTGRPLDALKLYESAVEWLMGAGDLRAAGVCQCNRATAWLDLPNFKECENALKLALELATRCDSPRVFAMAYAIMGDMRRDQQRWLEAGAAYQRAHEKYLLLGNRQFAAWQLAERALVLAHAGEADAPAAWALALDALHADAPADLAGYAAKWQAAVT
jgi:tetratricopeptide (TPR) repeat protein